MTRQRRTGAAAVLSVLLAIALLGPFGSSGAAGPLHSDQPGSATPAAESGSPGKALLDSRSTIRILITRAGADRSAVTSWALPAGLVRPVAGVLGAPYVAPETRAPRALRVNSLGGRAPPRLSV